MNLDDVDKYTEWLNDYEITQYLTVAPMTITLHSEKEALLRLSQEHNYAIIDIATDKLLGSCGLIDIDKLNRTAEVGIFIGDKNFLGRGYGREALSLLIDYAFTVLNMNNIMLRVYSFNERAIRSYESIGFKVIGKRRKALIRNRKEYDIYFMDILASEYYK